LSIQGLLDFRVLVGLLVYSIGSEIELRAARCDKIEGCLPVRIGEIQPPVRSAALVLTGHHGLPRRVVVSMA
jgi:hypothetical protein